MDNSDKSTNDKNTENKGGLRKYIIVYIFLFAVLIIVFLTHGIPNGIIIHEVDHRDWMDGVKYTMTFLVYNAGIILLCFITSIITTLHKGNRIRFKWLIPILMLIISIVCLPVFLAVQIGGFSGGIYNYYYTIAGNCIEQTHNGRRMEISRESSSGGTYTTAVVVNQDRMTLDDVIRISTKGEEATWNDFEQYESTDIGSGLYIQLYDIDETFELMIGGTGTSDKPIYIRLVLKADESNYIDIRTDDVEAFIEENSSGGE